MGNMVLVICRGCGKQEYVPPLSQQDIDNGEELPDICQDCPADMLPSS